MGIVSTAKVGGITEDMLTVAKDEGVDAEKIRRYVAEGRIVILRNSLREQCHPVGVGKGLRTKVNANVGTSTDLSDIDSEIEKATAAVAYGADTVMDLSTGGNLDAVRRAILKAVKVPVGSVPIYQAAIEALKRRHAVVDMTEDDLFSIIERHAKDGVDFMTIHAAITKETVDRLKRSPRVTGIVSRGGAFLASWILHHEKENPLYRNFDCLLEIAKRYDFCISIGDALRPGCLADADDWYQHQELLKAAELVERCRSGTVQVIVEGPGHLPLNQIRANVIIEKSICKGAPFYVLGPLVTDIGAGYDHIVGAIGGAVAAAAGADFLCYVTPTEHLGLPTLEDVREGVAAARLAAHAADIVKLRKRAFPRDFAMAEARAKLEWDKQYELSIDPARARKIRESRGPKAEGCSMCGEYCVFKVLSMKQRVCL
ncbi:MAG: phosphomethylpyrimidine synthase ThiC [Candidatus Bathyarchaeia archaeon]